MCFSRVLRRLLMAASGVVLLSVACPRLARAEADVDTKEVQTYVVQERLFREGLELNGAIGILPLNAFSKGVVLGGSVAYHFTNLWSWEIAHGGYVIANADTGLRSQLINNFDVQPTALSRATFLVDSNVVFTPFYAKVAGLNRSVDHLELFFPVGLAFAGYQDPTAYLGGLDLGLGLRWYLSPHTSIRFDARNYLLAPGFKNFSITDELLFSLGLSVAFGGDAR
jgi:outer membrane beta-barrel protein